jgi:hypothetical protein
MHVFLIGQVAGAGLVLTGKIRPDLAPNSVA